MVILKKKNYFRYVSSHNVHVNFKQNLVSRSVKTLRTNLFAKNRKLHKFATTNNKFEKKSMILDMHHRKTCMYIYFQTNQVSKSVNLISAHKCICQKKSHEFHQFATTKSFFFKSIISYMYHHIHVNQCSAKSC